MTSRTTRKTTGSDKPKAPAATKVTGRGKAATAPTPDAVAAAPKTRTSSSSKPAATPEPAATPVARAAKAAAKPAAKPAAAKNGIDATRRHQLICEIAYGLYVARGYIGGRDLSDWLQAEAEVDRMLAKATPEKPGGTD
jgi:hypothetical protein